MTARLARRSLAAALLLVLPAAAGLAGVHRAAALGACPASITATLNAAATSCSVAAGTDVTQNIVLAGSSSQERVLDISATTAGGGDFFLCLWGNQDTTKYSRSSHVTGSTVQRVALADPYWSKYQVELISLAPGANLQGLTGPCAVQSLTSFLGSAQAYTLNVSYSTQEAAAPSGGFSFSTRHLPDANTLSLGGTPGAGEPTIVVDATHGNRVYVSAPTGVPAGVNCAFPPNPSGPCMGDDFWYSTDGGNTFSECNAGGLTGGGDSHTAVDSSGSIYNVDLAATHVYTQKLPSTASGPATPTTAVGCGFTATQPTDFEADRQWIATYLPDPAQGTSAAVVRVGYHDLAEGVPINCESTDGGQTFPLCVPELDPTNAPLVADAAGNTVIGPQVFDSKGNDYEVFETSTAPDNLAGGGGGPEHNIYIATSPDGVSWKDYPVYQSTPYGTTGNQNVDQLFAVLAVDRADNLYTVWSQGAVCAAWNSVCPAHVYLATSTDHGQHWSAPTQVDSGLSSAVLPWVVAGADGMVDVAYAGSSTSTNPAGDVRADWSIYMAQSLNAQGAHPSFRQSVVSPYPVRRGQICESGLNCSFNGDDGRILLDFLSIAIDSQCRARIAYADAGPDPSNGSRNAYAPFTDYAAQTAGATLCPTTSPFTAGAGLVQPDRAAAAGLLAGGLVLVLIAGGLMARRRAA